MDSSSASWAGLFKLLLLCFSFIAGENILVVSKVVYRFTSLMLLLFICFCCVLKMKEFNNRRNHVPSRCTLLKVKSWIQFSDLHEILKNRSLYLCLVIWFILCVSVFLAHEWHPLGGKECPVSVKKPLGSCYQIPPPGFVFKNLRPIHNLDGTIMLNHALLWFFVVARLHQAWDGKKPDHISSCKQWSCVFYGMWAVLFISSKCVKSMSYSSDPYTN